jgi:hypothetical protein
MANYDFRSLSPIDFEMLVRDLLQEKLGLPLQSFKTGQDRGIDFRYSSDNANTIVVQCKHYVESGFKNLKNILKAKELIKIHELKPKRYIIATSVPLNPSEKDEIVSILAPYILSANDVYGKDDLNNLLGQFPRIERKSIKLWLLSLPLLEEVLHSATNNLSRYEVDRIQEHAKLYVQNKSFDDAVRILEEYKFCIIAGAPGIGKTILAEMLLLHYIHAGYDVIKISEDIKEAWNFSVPDSKLIYYYDDFLGQSSFQEKLSKNEDQRIIDFIHAIRKASGVKLIFTTREYILQQAYQQYEKLDREGLDSQKCIVDLSKYSRLNRAHILFNHLYFSDLPVQYKDQILNNRSYLRIIDHRNYSPRIIQIVTTFIRLKNIEHNLYIEFIITNLDNPLAIWEHAFEKQLSQSARNLLLVLISLPHEVFISNCERAFQNYNSAYAKKFVIPINPQDFRSAIKELDGDFLVYEREGEITVIKFRNPSIRDYVRGYLFNSKAELNLLIQSVVYQEQLSIFWTWSESRSVVVAYVKNNSAEFENMLRQLFSADTCRLINIRRGNIQKKETWPRSIEENLALYVDIAVNGNKSVFIVVRELLTKVLARIWGKDYDRDGLGQLIEKLGIVEIIDLDDSMNLIIDDGIKALSEDARWANDLRPLCELVKKFPGWFPDEKFRVIEKTIIDVVESIAHGNPDIDFNQLREEAETFKSLSAQISIDIEDEINRILEMADEQEELWEERRRETTDDDIDLPAEVRKNGDEVSDEVIASMFTTLNDIL